MKFIEYKLCNHIYNAPTIKVSYMFGIIKREYYFCAIRLAWYKCSTGEKIESNNFTKKLFEYGSLMNRIILAKYFT